MSGDGATGDRQLAAGPALEAVTLRMAVLVGFTDEVAARRWLGEGATK
ncbi:MAG: hypothetical protein ABI895_08530 [Deltaproteobacteria bacterium]